MEIIKDGKMTLFEVENKVSKARGARACLIEDFCKELDKDIGRKYKDKKGKIVSVKKSKPATVAFFLAHLNLGDLYYFYSSCKSARVPFRQAFYGGLKNK